MALHSEMRQLAQNLLEAHGDRVIAVAGIRTGTAQVLADCRADRQAMAVERQQWLSEQMEALRHDVGGMRLAAAALVQELDAAHQEMATGQRQYLDEQIEELRRSMAAFLGELDAAHQEMATGQRQQLGDYMGELCHSVSQMRHDAAAFVQELDMAHRELAAEQRAQLDEGRDCLASDTGAFLKAAGVAHQEMAAEQRQRLSHYLDELRQHVEAMRTTFQGELGQVRADQHSARGVWTGFAAIMRNRRAGRPAAPPPAAPAPLPPPPTPAEEPAAPAAPLDAVAADDLTAIRGIGATMQERLNQAGIRTFAELAHSTADELRELLDVGRLVKVEEWISQAQDLIRST